jgi:hypothetical protein
LKNGEISQNGMLKVANGSMSAAEASTGKSARVKAGVEPIWRPFDEDGG